MVVQAVLLLGFLFLLLYPVWAHLVHKSGDVPSIADVQQVAGAASHGTVKVDSVFAGTDGLVGAVVTSTQSPDARNIVWFTPHLKAVVVNGSVLDASGQNLTQQARYTQGLLWRPAKVLAAVAKAPDRTILVGSRGPVLTAFFDPNCTFCHQLYQQLAPALAAGKLRLRVVLVGIVKASSKPRAASILAAADPAAALAANEAHFDVRHEEGGAAIRTEGVTQATAAVAANMALFDKAGTRGTPTLLYCSRSRKQVQQVPGLPRDLNALVQDLAPASVCSEG